MNPDDNTQEIIEHKITKVNGQSATKKYLKGKLLGKGGFAKCYEGKNLDTNKLYAIKVIQKNTLQKSRAKQKLMSQIKIHKTLHHHHIVQFDSVFEDQKNVYIILQLCTNKVDVEFIQTLSQMVKKRKRLTIKQTRYYMLQLISGLQYMHSNRVIHRDLKMGNIFLSSTMEMKIGDFGLATKLQFLDEKKRTMCGTPNYIAPEIVEGAVGHSYQVDIWSSGVICYALLFGRPPFETTEVKTTYKKIKNCQYTFPNSSTPQQAKDFIQKILVLDPKKRLTIKQMLQHPFINNEDIPKSIPVDALVTLPNFKNGNTEEVQQLMKTKSTDRLRPQDFKKITNNQNGLLEGMLSPRTAFNEPQTQRIKLVDNKPLQQMEDHLVNVLTFVDYSTKYGLGYLINNKEYGVYFNDSSVVSINGDRTMVRFIDNATGKEQKIDQYKIDALPTDRNFQKKFQLLERFIVSLNDQLAKITKEKINFIESNGNDFVYMKQWLKTRHAIMFRLSNKIFQVNFFDNSQILLNTDKKTVLFTSKKGEKTYDNLSSALQVKDTEMARRIKYTKQILNSIRRGRDENMGQSENLN